MGRVSGGELPIWGPQRREPQAGQDLSEHLLLLSCSIPLPREDMGESGPKGLKPSPALCLAGASPHAGEKGLVTMTLGQQQG